MTSPQDDPSPSTPPAEPERVRTENARYEMLHRLEDWLETPLLVLGLLWLLLMVVEFTRGESAVLTFLSTVIWVIFILDFVLKLTLAPHKIEYLKRNALTVVALAIPALRVFRIFRVVRVLRAARAARGIRLVRVVTSLNRGMRSLGSSMSRRGFGYVLTLTTLVTLAGAAGMYAFEKPAPGESGIESYGDALWWTAMLMTTIASEYWPRTAEGRLLCFLLSLYALAVFSYITATIATYFIDREADSPDSQIPNADSVESLRVEIRSLREEIRSWSPPQAGAK